MFSFTLRSLVFSNNRYTNMKWSRIIDTQKIMISMMEWWNQFFLCSCKKFCLWQTKTLIRLGPDSINIKIHIIRENFLWTCFWHKCLNILNLVFYHPVCSLLQVYIRKYFYYTYNTNSPEKGKSYLALKSFSVILVSEMLFITCFVPFSYVPTT